MLRKVLRSIRDNRLFVGRETVVVAVSGGADSVALLDILVAAAELELTLVVAHLNHMLRAGEADADERFVRCLADGYNLPCVTRAVDVGELSRQLKMSLEEAGRVARYSFFEEVAESSGAAAVALGHHLDDQAETVLMRLVRGAGGTGLSGMSFKSRGGRYVRPLLGVSRQDILLYLQSRSLQFRVDGSNTDVKFLRNRIRHELLPIMRHYNPEIVMRLTDTARNLQEDESLLSEITEREYLRVIEKHEDVAFDVSRLLEAPSGLRMRLYRQAIHHVQQHLAGISRRHLDAVDDLARSSKPQASITLPSSLTVERSYNLLFFKQSAPDTDSIPYEFTISGPGSYPIPGGGSISVRLVSPVPSAQLSLRHQGVIYIDVDKAPFPWTVRPFRPGDRLAPAGSNGTRKVKDIYIDKKVRNHDRQRIPLLLSCGTIIWIAGIRAGRSASISLTTETVAIAEILDFTP